MALNVFIDSSFLISLLIDQEKTHNLGKSLIKKFSHSRFYFNQLVVLESSNVICRKWGISKLKIFSKWLRSNLKKNTVRIIDVDNEMIVEILDNLVKNYTKSGPNIFDFIHFACMQKYSIKNILTFDKHFQKFGFNILV